MSRSSSWRCLASQPAQRRRPGRCALVDQRHDQERLLDELGPGDQDGGRVVLGIGDHHGLSRLDDGAGDALAQPQAQPVGRLARVLGA